MRTPHERLQAFLYILTRDHLPVGVIDGIIEALRLRDMADLEDVCRRKPLVEAVASDLADRLIGKEEPEPEYRYGIYRKGRRVDPEIYLSESDAERHRNQTLGEMILRGRVVETTTTVANEIEWEDTEVHVSRGQAGGSSQLFRDKTDEWDDGLEARNQHAAELREPEYRYGVCDMHEVDEDHRNPRSFISYSTYEEARRQLPGDNRDPASAWVVRRGRAIGPHGPFGPPVEWEAEPYVQ